MEFEGIIKMAMKKAKEYENSPKNIQDCQPFCEECERLHAIGVQYKGKFELLYQEAMLQSVNVEYGLGGRTLHRGYYSSSLVDDIIIGNCSRGRRIKNKTEKLNISYEYHFNADGYLVLVKIGEGRFQRNEVFVRFDDTVWGFEFNSFDKLSVISEEKYEEGKIKEYITCSYQDEYNQVFNYCKEVYHYEDNRIRDVDLYSFTPEIMYLSHDKYTFKHDEQGYLSTYTLTEYQGNRVKKSVYDGHVFKVNKRRKV